MSPRLRPHVKTHKMPEIIGMQLRHGIEKFKCATIAEAEMTASCGAADILLAMQPVGPAIGRFFRLKQAYPEYKHLLYRRFGRNTASAIRNSCQAQFWSRYMARHKCRNEPYGVSPGDEAIRLYKLADSLPKLKAAGLHAYDGHIHEKDFDTEEADLQ